tara:strand:- start:440 stop:604 length:165 start_codon:yes stop_codon:yes gene_type:complete
MNTKGANGWAIVKAFHQKPLKNGVNLGVKDLQMMLRLFLLLTDSKYLAVHKELV